MRLHLKRVHIRGAVVGLALTLGSGVLLAATPVAASSTTGPCETAGATGIAVAHSHGAPVECVMSTTSGQTIQGSGSGTTAFFLKID